MDSHLKTAILACGTLKQELTFVRDKIRTSPPDLFFLDSGLHLTPKKMLNPLQNMLNSLARTYPQVVLGFGLCSNGVVGLNVPQGDVMSTLIIPKAHDCLDFFLNYVGRSQKRLALPLGYYFLTPGSILEHKDPLGILNDIYLPRMGKDMALWGIKQELAHYSHFVLLLNGIGDREHLQDRARENADFFDKKIIIQQRDLSFFQHLVCGPYPAEKFIRLLPGATVRQEMFLS